MKEKVSRLELGLPQKWIYIERQIIKPLKSNDSEGIKASQNFVGKNISDIFYGDLLNIYNQRIAKVRPVIGANGAGKTTLLKYHVKEYMEKIAPGSNLFFFFDFKGVCAEEDEFWRIFVQKLIRQIYDEDKDKYKIREIIGKIPESKRRMDLFKIFKNKGIVDNLLKLASLDPNEQFVALEFFYDETKTVRNLFFGLLKLVLKLDYLVTIVFDEIQYLNEIDSNNVLLKIFLENFIRHSLEEFRSERLYLLVSCLENPEIHEWTELISRSKNFETIVKNREISLGNLTPNEKDEIIKQVADKIGFNENDQKVFFTKVKSSLLYYLPRDLLKCIANVIDAMDYVGYTDHDIRLIYEEDARNHIADILKEKGFIHIEKDVRKVGGYDIDIYATGATQRTGYVQKAYGEVTMIKRAGMKGKIEKFSNWLLRMKDREYKPDKGDFAFFICPYNSITEGAKEVLKSNNIELFEYTSPNVDELLSRSQKSVECASDENEDSEEKEQATFVKESKYKLTDVPGIGAAKSKALNDAGIITIKDLLNCNVKIISKEIKGVGEASLNKWRQAARQILDK